MVAVFLFTNAYPNHVDQPESHCFGSDPIRVSIIEGMKVFAAPSRDSIPFRLCHIADEKEVRTCNSLQTVTDTLPGQLPGPEPELRSVAVRVRPLPAGLNALSRLAPRTASPVGLSSLCTSG